MIFGSYITATLSQNVDGFFLFL